MALGNFKVSDGRCFYLYFMDERIKVPLGKVTFMACLDRARP